MSHTAKGFSMSTAAKLRTTLAALALVTFSVSGCTATTAPQADSSSKPVVIGAPEPTTAPATAETDADSCADPARILFGRMSASLKGELVDLGTREFAMGTVERDDEGTIVSYTVAAGDVTSVIGERLCIENATSMATLNHTGTIHPGQVLRFDRNPDVLWVPYANPDNVPAGFQPDVYQSAIEAMAAAGDAGEVDTMRTIWADELSGLFLQSANKDVIQQALDRGDIDVLRQMFS